MPLPANFWVQNQAPRLKRAVRGLLALLMLIALLILWEKWGTLHSSRIKTKQEQPGWVQAWQQKAKNKKESTTQANPDRVQLQAHSINPNTASLDKLQKLPWPDWVAENLIKYRNKGGRFYDSADLARLYGLEDSLLQQVLPYLKLEPQDSRSSTYNGRKQKDWASKPKPRKPYRYQIEPFELNSAAAEDFMQIRGIGTAYSMRIIRFREKLGGFSSKDQLYEVYGLDSALVDSLLLYTSLEPSKAKPRQLDINAASYDSLKAHPYINWRIAKLIVAYREQHGPYDSVGLLKKIKIMRPKNYRKMAPYLKALPVDTLRAKK